MKKLQILIAFILMVVVSFSANVKNIRYNHNPPQVVFDLEEGNIDYETAYDENTRLLFLNIGGKKPTYNKGVSNKLTSHLESISEYKYNYSHGFFLKLNKNIFHNVSKRTNPNRIVVDLSKSKNNKQYTIVIDPGHGGKDPGAIGRRGAREKDIVLAVGKGLRTALGKDFNVIMTRDTDKFISLRERSRISNDAGAHLFISLHANSAKNNTATGMEIFYFSKTSSNKYAESIARIENEFGNKYGEDTNSIVQIAGEITYNKNQEKSIPFAEKLNTDLARKTGLRDRGIHGANFAVLRGIEGPGVLVEVGFINNVRDHKMMTSRSGQKKLVDTIANHVRNYFY